MWMLPTGACELTSDEAFLFARTLQNTRGYLQTGSWADLYTEPRPPALRDMDNDEFIVAVAAVMGDLFNPDARGPYISCWHESILVVLCDMASTLVVKAQQHGEDEIVQAFRRIVDNSAEPIGEVDFTTLRNNLVDGQDYLSCDEVLDLIPEDRAKAGEMMGLDEHYFSDVPPAASPFAVAKAHASIDKIVKVYGQC